jgi:hypothetical protein
MYHLVKESLMPSEYIMYLSILLVGTLAIAGISVTMIAINNTMEVTAIETNMENITQNIAETIHNLINEGQEQIYLGALTITMQRPISLPEEIHGEPFKIEITSTVGSYFLKASALENEEVTVSISLFIDPSSLSMSGTISSLNPAPTIVYEYNGVDITITLID